MRECQKGDSEVEAAKNNTFASSLQPPMHAEHLLILMSTTLNAHLHYYHRRDKGVTNAVLGNDAGRSIGRGVEFLWHRGECKQAASS